MNSSLHGGGIKSPLALRTIGEVAKQLGIPQHVLRFWEGKFPQITPEKHRGRRYYRQEDVVRLEYIKALLYKEGYTIKGVQVLLNNKNTKQLHSPQPDLFREEGEEGELQQPSEKKVTNIVAKNRAAINRKQLQAVLDILRESRDILKKHL